MLVEEEEQEAEHPGSTKGGENVATVPNASIGVPIMICTSYDIVF